VLACAPVMTMRLGCDKYVHNRRRTCTSIRSYIEKEIKYHTIPKMHICGSLQSLWTYCLKNGHYQVYAELHKPDDKLSHLYDLSLNDVREFIEDIRSQV
jgi:hypothetical protein